MKILKYSLLALLLVVVGAVVAAWLYLEPLVKGAVHKFGTQVVGTEVVLNGFKFHPLDGEVEITGLTVANPDGYTAPNLLSLGRIFVKLDVKSLLSNTIIVENVEVDKPEITYEMPDFSTSNVMQIQQNIAKNTSSTTPKEETVVEEEVEEGEPKEPKKVIIKKVLVEGGSLSAITPLQTNNTALTLVMPAVELVGIGEDKHSLTIQESIVTVFNKILFNATSVVTKALGSATEMAEKAASATLDTAKNAVAEEAEGLLDKVKFW
ncbi:MAG: AsmA family protein [Alphaproteobacteria bacterium]|nr:AsmA family protein [Alphaproteobacteria bacterium]